MGAGCVMADGGAGGAGGRDPPAARISGDGQPLVPPLVLSGGRSTAAVLPYRIAARPVRTCGAASSHRYTARSTFKNLKTYVGFGSVAWSRGLAVPEATAPATARPRDPGTSRPRADHSFKIGPPPDFAGAHGRGSGLV